MQDRIIALSFAASAQQVRVRFDGAFYASARSHHLTKRDVERVLRWPRSVEELTVDESAFVGDVVTAWFAPTPVALPGDPSSILVLAHGRRGDQQGHDAWRLYHRELDLSRVRSARDAFRTFLDRYGVDLRLGHETRRHFSACTAPMVDTGQRAWLYNSVRDRQETILAARRAPGFAETLHTFRREPPKTARTSLDCLPGMRIRSVGNSVLAILACVLVAAIIGGLILLHTT